MIAARLSRISHLVHEQPALLPAGLACMVAVLWALVEALGSLVPARYSPFQTVWVRYAAHLLFLLIVWGPRRKASLIRTPRWKGQILRGLMMLGMPAGFVLASSSLPLNTVWSIFWTAPLLGMAGAAVLLKEKVTPAAWAAALLGFTGALLILRPAFAGGPLQMLLALGMTLCFALYMLATRLLNRENTLTSLFYTAFAVFLPLSGGTPTFWQPLTWKAAAVMALIGLAGFALLFALERALETAPVGLVAPFLYGVPLWSLLWSEIHFHSAFHLRDLAGALLILLSAAAFFYFQARRARVILPALTAHFRSR